MRVNEKTKWSKEAREKERKRTAYDKSLNLTGQAVLSVITVLSFQILYLYHVFLLLFISLFHF